MSFVARETEITESMSARTWISPVPDRGKDVVQMKIRSGGRSGEIDPCDAPNTKWRNLNSCFFLVLYLKSQYLKNLWS